MARRRGPRLVHEPKHHGVTQLPDKREMGWASFGDPDGDVVVWFHGTPGGRCQIPGPAVAEAEARHLRIVCIERPGTGHSTPHSYHRVVDHVPDVEAVLDDLGVGEFAGVGLSGGGPYLLATAHELGDRMRAGAVLGGIGPTRGTDAVISHTMGLVPLGSVLDRLRGPLGTGLGITLRALAPYGKPFIDAFFVVEWGDRRAMADDPESKAQLLADLIDAAHRSGVRAPFDDLVLFGRHWGFHLNDVKVPITFWGGTSDPIVPYVHAERQAKRVPGARLRTVPSRGHFAGYTEVHEVFDTLREHWPAVRPAPQLDPEVRQRRKAARARNARSASA